MATVPRALAAIALVVAATAAAAAQSLKPQWSRPVGGKTRFVGVEEYGRCSVFVDNGAIQVVAPSGEISWTWPLSKISKYLNPRDVAVSHECDAIALVGDATYKMAWIIQQTGKTTRLTLTATPAEASFEDTGSVSIGMYSGATLVYTRDGEYAGTRQASAKWSPASNGQETVQQRIAVSTDGSRSWMRGDDSIECVDGNGAVLATIDVAPNVRGVRVSRDFGQVLIVTEKDLHPVSVERYEIPQPCSPADLKTLRP